MVRKGDPEEEKEGTVPEGAVDELLDEDADEDEVGLDTPAGDGDENAWE